MSLEMARLRLDNVSQRTWKFIDENIERRKGLRGPGEERLALIPLAHVADYRQGLAAHFANFIGDHVQCRLLAAAHDEIGPVLGETESDRPPDSSAGSRHKGYLSF